MASTHKLIVEVAERLFRQIGFQKTTVADIALELHMSPANVYRFFAAKSEIHEAVCMDLVGKIEAEVEKIAASRSTATQRIRDLIGIVEKVHQGQYMFDRKLHDLVKTAISENWPIMRRHDERMAAILEQIIASGMASGEFPLGDATLAARRLLMSTRRYPPEEPEAITQPRGGPPLKPSSAGAALPLPTEQDHFLSLGRR